MANYEMPFSDTRAMSFAKLPIATKEKPGVVIVGSGLDVSIDGILSVNSLTDAEINDINTILKPETKFLSGKGLKIFMDNVSNLITNKMDKIETATINEIEALFK